MGMRDIATGVFLGLVFFIAGFGILNTMLMSVFERTREIGTMRAIGAQRGPKGKPTGRGGGGSASTALAFARRTTGAYLGAASHAFQIAFEGTLLRLGKHKVN